MMNAARQMLVLMIGISLAWVSAEAQQPPASATDRGIEIASDSLIGAKVRNPEGREIGSVKNLMIDPKQGKINSVSMSIGGFIGMGEKTILVPWDGVTVGRDGQRLVVTVPNTVLEQAPSASPRTPGTPQNSGTPQNPPPPSR